MVISSLAVVVVLAAGAAGGEDAECRSGQGEVRKTVKGNKVSILPAGLKNPDGGFAGCRASIVSPSGSRIFSAEDYGIALYETDKDVDGDGQVDMVFEGYSGGAHCCWKYWVVSLDRRPATRLVLENERGAAFVDQNGDGKVEIWTLDGVFDYFDGLSHAETVFPTLVLRLDGRQLEDISAQFRSAYDEQIKAARSRLASVPVTALQKAKTRGQLYEEARKAIPAVLEIVLSYLYSGRDQEAWKTLREYWPAHDYPRMRRLIQKTRREGLLRYVSGPSRVATPTRPR